MTKETFWNMRAKCSKEEHKFRDNDFGVTWCVVCGKIALKSCGKPLLETNKIITTNLI